MQKLVIKDHVRIGHLNIIRGGDLVSLGRYSEIIRLNEINSIPDPEVVNPIDPTLILGDGSIVTTGQEIDFTDRVEIGKRVILGGRNSSLWTHNRQSDDADHDGAMVYTETSAATCVNNPRATRVRDREVARPGIAGQDCR